MTVPENDLAKSKTMNDLGIKICIYNKDGYLTRINCSFGPFGLNSPSSQQKVDNILCVFAP